MPAQRHALPRSRHRFRSLVGIAAFTFGVVLLATSCGDDDSAGPAPPEEEEDAAPAEILLSLERDSVELEQSTTVSGQVVDSNGDPVEAEIIWISDDPLIAQVNSEGVVTTVAPGMARITAAAGQLEETIPIFVLPPFRFVDLSAGAQDTCALTEHGATYCWGLLTDSRTPTRVAQEYAFVQITSEDVMTCGLTSVGEAYCWGRNLYQRMGNSVGDEAIVVDPIPIEHSEPFRHIHLGLHGGVCGIEESDTLVCWGHNDYGQVGRATESLQETEILPVAVDAGFTVVSLGAFHGCGVAEGGRGYCWGSNSLGALGVGEETEGIHPPLPVAGDLTFDSVVSGLYFSCAVATDDRAFCWGYNDEGQLGLGDTAIRWTPTPIQGHRFSSLAAGQEHACGVTTEGQALCWGAGSTVRSVAGDIEFQQLSAAQGHTCGISSLGVVYCWGNGQLGREGMAISSEPVPIEWPADVGAD